MLWISISWWTFPGFKWLSFIGTRARHMAADDPFEAIEKDLRRPVPIGNGGQGIQNLSNPVAFPQGDPANPPFLPQTAPAMPYRYGPQTGYATNPHAFSHGDSSRPPFPPVPAPGFAHQYGPQYGYATNPTALPQGDPTRPPFPPFLAPPTSYHYGPPYGYAGWHNV